MVIVKWVLSLFLISGFLVYFPHLSSFIFLFCGVVLLHIKKWQSLFANKVPSWKIVRIILVAVLFIVGCLLAPKQDTTNQSSNAGSGASSSSAAADISEPDSSSLASSSSASQPETLIPENSSFQIDFIDVGQADAALVSCDGNYMLIDGGNAEDSNLIYSYLSQRNINYLDYIVCTHAHEDHVGGLSGALNYADVGTAFCPVTEYDSEAFNHFTEALAKKNAAISVPAPGDAFSLGSATVTIYGPISDSDDPNNTSIVLRIVYGETSFLFTGDAERDEEQDILNSGVELKSTVLKVGHHGSDTSTTYPFLREIMPEYAVISVGTDNSYGHPTEDTLSRLRDADVKVYRTDMQGDIICTSDGKTVTMQASRNADIDTLSNAGGKNNSSGSGAASNSSAASNNGQTAAPEQQPAQPAAPSTSYVVNTNTGKFHYPSCSSADDIAPHNRMDYTGSREDLIAQGYVPCKRCHP